MKNANSTWLNGQPFDNDLSQRLNREVRLANDANCLAVSEAVDGAAAGAQTVFAVIIGTGCGAGVAITWPFHIGGNGTAGEWGHNPLPWMDEDELRYRAEVPCYCGKQGCIETFISGTGFCHGLPASERPVANGQMRLCSGWRAGSVGRTGAEALRRCVWRSRWPTWSISSIRM
ncbi:Fructokinase [Raoultella planticola]|uniref:Fructokinase n=1 Tax=Raoultella planticola TaxID=575 RepID=A0A485AG57_RAOPL|nr:Fructokinase [Raoultella planticola]